MKEVQISTFKAQCLQLLDEVNRTEEQLVVTRHGQPLVVINPFKAHSPKKGFGIAKGSAKIVGDIVSPVSEPSDWEVLS